MVFVNVVSRYGGGVATFVLVVLGASLSLIGGPFGFLSLAGGSFGLVSIAAGLCLFGSILSAIGISVFAGEVFRHIPNIHRHYSSGYWLVISGTIAMFLAAVFYMIQVSPPPPAPVAIGAPVAVPQAAIMPAAPEPQPATRSVKPRRHRRKHRRHTELEASSSSSSSRSSGYSSSSTSVETIDVPGAGVYVKRHHRHRSHGRHRAAPAPDHDKFHVPLEPLLKEEYAREGLALADGPFGSHMIASQGQPIYSQPSYPQKQQQPGYVPYAAASYSQGYPSRGDYESEQNMPRYPGVVRTVPGIPAGGVVRGASRPVSRRASLSPSPVRPASPIRFTQPQRPFDEEQYWREGRPV